MASLLGYFGVLSDIDEPLINIPNKFSISQNFPNPFNPSTQFVIEVPLKERVEIKIFNLLGQEVETVVSDVLSPGKYNFTWNAQKFASGFYLLEMRAGDFIQTKKMLLLK
jgi:hypothetical protein